MNFDDLLSLIRGQVVKIKIELEISLVPSPDSAHVGEHTAKCAYCSWERQYSSASSARQGLSGHLGHCPSYAEQVGYIDDLMKSKNGA